MARAPIASARNKGQRGAAMRKSKTTSGMIAKGNRAISDRGRGPLPRRNDLASRRAPSGRVSGSPIIKAPRIQAPDLSGIGRSIGDTIRKAAPQSNLIDQVGNSIKRATGQK